MLSLRFPLLLACLALAQEPRHDPRPKPKRPEDLAAKRDKPEPLIKLPDDFVQFARVPDGGRLPRVATDGGEAVLLYFKSAGEDAAGDLFLTRSADEGRTFAPSTPLNADSGSVPVHKGIHPGSLDLGPDGLAHVTWISAGDAPVLLYVREKAKGELEAVQDLGAAGPGASSAVTVDSTGQVYVFHAALAEAPEDGSVPVLRIWMRRSTPGGAFGEPIAIDEGKEGVSAGSAIGAHVDDVTGTVFVIYRTAAPKGDRVVRDVQLLSSDDGGETFETTLVERKKQNNEPYAHASLVQEIQTTLVTWETLGFVSWAAVYRKAKKIAVPIAPKDEEGMPKVWRSRPITAAGGNEVILAWLEQPQDDRKAPAGVCWQVWYRDGVMPIGRGRAPETVGDSNPAIVPRAKGGFTILY